MVVCSSCAVPFGDEYPEVRDFISLFIAHALTTVFPAWASVQFFNMTFQIERITARFDFFVGSANVPLPLRSHLSMHLKSERFQAAVPVGDIGER